MVVRVQSRKRLRRSRRKSRRKRRSRGHMQRARPTRQTIPGASVDDPVQGRADHTKDSAPRSIFRRNLIGPYIVRNHNFEWVLRARAVDLSMELILLPYQWSSESLLGQSHCPQPTGALAAHDPESHHDPHPRVAGHRVATAGPTSA